MIHAQICFMCLPQSSHGWILCFKTYIKGDYSAVGKTGCPKAFGYADLSIFTVGLYDGIYANVRHWEIGTAILLASPLSCIRG